MVNYASIAFLEKMQKICSLSQIMLKIMPAQSGKAYEGVQSIPAVNIFALLYVI